MDGMISKHRANWDEIQKLKENFRRKNPNKKCCNNCKHQVDTPEAVYCGLGIIGMAPTPTCPWTPY